MESRIVTLWDHDFLINSSNFNLESPVGVALGASPIRAHQQLNRQDTLANTDVAEREIRRENELVAAKSVKR